MTTGFTSENVRQWTLEEAEAELRRIAREIESRGMSVKEFRYRASEWELEPAELALLRKYERLERMVAFAIGE